VYDIHDGFGLPNMTDPRITSAGKPYRTRAELFTGYHARHTCERTSRAHFEACSETSNKTRCDLEWPENAMRYVLFPRAW
jgi:hypothetical protein